MSAVPVGIPVVQGGPTSSGAPTVDIDELKRKFRRELQRDANAIEERFRNNLHRAGQGEMDRLAAYGLASQARVRETAAVEVTSSIRRKLPGALTAHLTNSEAVQQLVHAVERKVDGSAASVVARMASEEVRRCDRLTTPTCCSC